MGGVGGTQHAAEGGRLSTGQGSHRGDRGGWAVLVKGSLGVNRTLLTGPEKRSSVWLPQLVSWIDLQYLVLTNNVTGLNSCFFLLISLKFYPDGAD